MSGVLNDCDALLQGADVRIFNPKSAFIDLRPSAPGFHLNSAGVADLSVVTVEADLIGLDAAISFTAVGGTLSNATASSVDVTYAGSTAIVTATVVTNGETFARSCVIPVLRDGAAGQPAYTWIKYADTAAGAGLSDDPTGKAYIGLAHNKATATESTTPGDYTWAQMKGGDGLPGTKGADGITYYTWIKYADQADGTGLYDVPNANTLYIGIAVNRVSATESTTKTDYIWSRFKGEQGVAGAVTYTWIKYADTAAGGGLSDDPTGKAYIGFAYNKSTATESTTATDYAWSLIKGTDGQPGGKGADGSTLYTWIKYSDVADGTGLYDTPAASTLYIGIATNKSTATESAVKTDYVWSKFKGDQGVQGQTAYTWVKYADSAAGAGLSDDPTGKAYIGFAYNKSTATESTTATDYTWSLIKGTDGQPGGKGADGQTLYTWIKYADVADGTGLYDLPTASTQYLGLAVNKTTATESTVKTDYVWSKFRGADGVGTAGARGAGHYYVAGSSWSDVVAQAACPGGPVVNDVVTISSGTFVMEKRWTGSAWVDNGVVINGKLIVPDSILASSIDTRGLDIKDSAGNVIFSSGKTLADQMPINPNLVPRFSGWPAANFTNAGVGNSPGDARFLAGEFLVINDSASYAGASTLPLGIPQNSYVTVTFKAYCLGASRTLVVDFEGGGVDTVGISVPTTQTQTRFKFTEQITHANAAQAKLRVYSAFAASTIVVSDLKVEFGVKDTGFTDNVITPSNVGRVVMPDSISNTQIGGDLFSTNWNWTEGPTGTGWRIDRSGTIWANSVRLRGFIVGGNFTSYAWPASGSGFYAGPEGFKCGTVASGKYFNADQFGDVYAPNFSIINGIPSFANAVITSPKITTTFSVSVPSIIRTSQANTGSTYVFYGTLSVTPSGGVGPYTYLWTFAKENGDVIMVGDPTSSSVEIRGRGNDVYAIAWVNVLVRDANNALANGGGTIKYQHGTGQIP